MPLKNSDLPSIEEARNYLSGFCQEGCESWQQENEQYLQAHAHRFHETLAALPPGKPGDRLLELGATPYFMSLLLERYSNYDVMLANGVAANRAEQSTFQLIKSNPPEEHTFSDEKFNVEIDRFPYADDSFNLVLCSELIEHLALDPTHMLLEIHRVLVPGGKVMITTPNVLVLRNIVSLLKHQRNIYYPYSAYGVYGRHNREWTLQELVQLVSGCGFVIETAEVVDTYRHRGYSKLLKRFFPFLRDMLVVVGRAEGMPIEYYPSELYESYPKQYCSENPIPSRLQKKRAKALLPKEEKHPV